VTSRVPPAGVTGPRPLWVLLCAHARADPALRFPTPLGRRAHMPTRARHRPHVSTLRLNNRRYVSPLTREPPRIRSPRPAQLLPRETIESVRSPPPSTTRERKEQILTSATRKTPRPLTSAVSAPHRNWTRSLLPPPWPSVVPTAALRAGVRRFPSFALSTHTPPPSPGPCAADRGRASQQSAPSSPAPGGWPLHLGRVVISGTIWLKNLGMSIENGPNPSREGANDPSLWGCAVLISQPFSAPPGILRSCQGSALGQPREFTPVHYDVQQYRLHNARSRSVSAPTRPRELRPNALRTATTTSTCVLSDKLPLISSRMHSPTPHYRRFC